MEFFGTSKDGKKVNLHVISGKNISVGIIEYGAAVTFIRVPDKNGAVRDIALGYSRLSDYESHGGYLGAAVGRVANRINDARFCLDGKEYALTANNGKNCLHGGSGSFSHRIFSLVEKSADSVTLRYISPDNEGGFPGTLTTDIKYTAADGALTIEYFASTDKPTVINLTNHSYFNLSGTDGKENSIYEHKLFIDADSFLPVDDSLIPTGELKKAAGGAFDFTKPKEIGRDIQNADEQLKIGGGYDHNFCINGGGGTVKLCARAECGTSGLKMEVFTCMPGVQFYSGNFLDGSNGFNRRSAFCLETQGFPDAVNRPEFGGARLEPGEKYYSKTVYKFGKI